MKIMNPDLHKTYSKLVDRCLGISSLKISKSTKLPKIEAKKIIRNRNKEKTLRIETTKVPYYYGFVQRYETQINNLPEFQDFESIIRENIQINNHFSTRLRTFLSAPHLTPIDFIIFTLSNILQSSNGKLKPSPETSNQIYTDLEKFIYHSEIPVIDIVPLDNFNSDIETHELGSGITLRKITKKEKELILHMKTLSTFRAMSLKHVIEFRYNTSKTWSLSPTKEDNVLEILMPNLIDQFRIYKNGLIGYSAIIGKIDLLLPVGEWYFTRRNRELKEAILPDARPEYPVQQFNPKLYILWKKEISEFGQFREDLTRVPKRKLHRFNLALRRFKFSYGRELKEDKVIDLAICIETLFSQKEDSFDSIAYRLALRFSRLLSNNFDERKKIFKEIKSFYNNRSRIVHGDENDREKYLNQTDTTEIESYLRTALKSYIIRIGNKDLEHHKLMQTLDFS